MSTDYQSGINKGIADKQVIDRVTSHWRIYIDAIQDAANSDCDPVELLCHRAHRYFISEVRPAIAKVVNFETEDEWDRLETRMMFEKVS